MNLVNTGLEANMNANAAIDALLSAFSRKSAEERALILIREYFDAVERMWSEGDAGADRLTADFHAWYDDPRDRAAKDRAMDRLIEALEAKLEAFEKPEV